MTTPTPIKLSRLQAVENYQLLNSHTSKADKEYGFGVRGHTFVRIKNTDTWLGKQWFDLLKLINWISRGHFGIDTKQESIDTLKTETFKKLEAKYPDDAKKVSILVFKKTLSTPSESATNSSELQKEINFLKGIINRSTGPEEVDSMKMQIKKLKSDLAEARKFNSSPKTSSDLIQQVKILQQKIAFLENQLSGGNVVTQDEDVELLDFLDQEEVGNDLSEDEGDLSEDEPDQPLSARTVVELTPGPNPMTPGAFQTPKK